MYNIIALIGEAGSGKDYVLQNILNSKKSYLFNEIISCTTRPIREGEVEGVNYYYLTPEQFADKVLNCEMIEATNFNDWFYGTSYDSLRTGVINIGVFNPDGIRILLDNQNINLIVFKISCSDKTRLLRQLNREENPNVDEIVRRYGTDKKDFSHLDFNYIELKNENSDDLLNILHTIIAEAEKVKK